ncbi:MAG: SRPBCC domain-containing protein [Bacteroidetes bacterium]|nr:SRPBCC domain-containing protein [Bacteroidota bacterium]
MAKQIETTRIFRAPIEMVWRVWTEPDLVKRWWGPRHFIAPVAVIDFRVGGRSLVSMQAPLSMGGQVHYSVWEYVSITEHVSIEFIQSLSDPQGHKINPVTVGMPADFPRDIRTVVTFRAVSASETEMTITEYAEFGSISHFAQLGLDQSMDKMITIFA